MFCAAFFSYMYMSWYPKYLTAARGVSNVEAGWLSSMVMAGAAVGSMLGGVLSERLVAFVGDRRAGRRLMGSCAFALAAFFLFCSTRVDSSRLSAACMATAAMCGFMQLPNWWAVVADISGRHSGALFGLMNSMGGPGPFISQPFFGWMADRQAALGHEGRARWDPAFDAYIYVLLLGAVLWWFVDASKSAVTADRKPE
jgi:MFS family permease